MGMIKINIDGLLSQSGQAISARMSVSSAKNIVNAVRNQLDAKIMARKNIRSRLQNASRQLADVESRIQAIQATVEGGANSYHLAEQRLQNRAADFMPGTH